MNPDSTTGDEEVKSEEEKSAESAATYLSGEETQQKQLPPKGIEKPRMTTLMVVPIRVWK